MAKNGQNPQFTEEVMRAIVNTANDYGMHVAAHAHGDEGMYRAVRSGVKTIEHGSIMKERTMKLMREKNTYLVPTISAGEHVAKMAGIPGYYPAIIIPKALEVGVQNKASTNDGGKTWNLIADGQQPGYQSSVQYVPHSKGQAIFTAGIPGVSYSADGGDHWITLCDSSFYTIGICNTGRNAWLAGNNKIGKMTW